MEKKIFRKILSFFCMCLIFTGTASAERKPDNYTETINSVAPYTVNGEENSISRGDCVASVMKIVGVDKETEKMYNSVYFDAPIFMDVTGHRSCINDGYIIPAKYAKVAIGVQRYDVFGNPYSVILFEPHQNVTIKEALAFILRCLTDSSTLSWDNTMEDAVKYGLITQDELTDCEPDSELTNGQFRIFLRRMLNSPRYLYWPTEYDNVYGSKTAKTDITGSMKYIDWFNQVKHLVTDEA